LIPRKRTQIKVYENEDVKWKGRGFKKKELLGLIKYEDKEEMKRE